MSSNLEAIESKTSSKDPIKEISLGSRITIPLMILPTLFISVVISLPIALAFSSHEMTAGVLGTILAETLVVLIFTVFILKKNEISFSELFGFNNFKFSQIFFGGALGFLFLILASIVQNYINSRGGGIESSDTSQNLTSGSLFFIVFALLIAPILEEFIFRGLIFRLMHSAFESFRKAYIFVPYVFSSLLFSLMHFQGFSDSSDFAVLGVTFSFGVLLCLLTKRFGGISAAIAAHVVYNGIIIALTFAAS